MTITVPSGGFKSYRVFLNGTDITEYVVAESISYVHSIRQKSFAEFNFTVRRIVGFEMRGGHRTVFFLPGSLTPLFCGLSYFDVPMKRDPTTWEYNVKAVSWEQVFYRRQVYTNLNNLTFAGAVNQLLNDPEMPLPGSLSRTVLNTNDILSIEMGFYSVTGAFLGDLFSWVAQQVSGAWRVVPADTTYTLFQVEFFDPTYYSGLKPFRFDNTSKSFGWTTLQPIYNLRDIVNSQTVRGSMEPAALPITVYFRGDDLSSKFPLPSKPYNNTPRLLVYDAFDAQTIDDNTWLEFDVLGNYVYVDVDGFCQFDPIAGNSTWVGIISKSVATRGQRPSAIFDITWVSNGSMLMGLCDQEGVDTVGAFLDCGFYTDSSGFVYVVADHMGQGITFLQLVVDEVYRFRVTAKETGGCLLSYQTGDDNFTNTWTLLYEGGTSLINSLQYGIATQDAGFSLGIAKMQYPYLGTALRVDRGQGFKDEFVGVATDQDVDAVIEQEDVLSFFGDDPGPPSIPPAPAAKTFTVIDPTNDKMDVTGGHRILNGTEVQLGTTGTLPAPLLLDTSYWLLDVDSFNFKLCTDVFLTSVVDLTDTGTGVHTVLPIAWQDKSSDYKNVQFTYYQGVQINRTYIDNSLVTILQELFGDGDDGIREGALISDTSINNSDAALQRARVEVESRNKLIEEIKLKASWNILRQAGMGCPIIGDVARYSILVDDTDQIISGDLPIQALQMKAKLGGQDFDFDITGGQQPRGLREVLKTLLDAGQITAITDAQILYKNRTLTEVVDVTDELTFFAGYSGRWGDSRYDTNVVANVGANTITAYIPGSFVQGGPDLTDPEGTTFQEGI